MDHNADLNYARNQLAYWSERVIELEKTDADRRREEIALTFLSAHSVVALNPPHTVPIRVSVDGEELSECEFIEQCGLWRVCPGTLYKLASKR